MEGVEKEQLIEEYPLPVTIEGTNIILNQLSKCICKIENKKGNGTGFFCSINEKLKVLITNNHIIDEQIILENSKIRVTLNDDKDFKIINLKDKKYYTDEKYDTTILEINPEKDNIDNFLELDKEIFEYNADKPKSVYLLQYPCIDYYKQKAAVSYGIIKKAVDEYNIIHYCCTENGSSGSPILNILNNKLIGIHKESIKNKNYNRGTLLKYPINEYLQKYFNKENRILLTEENNNDEINEIKLALKIEKKDINKNIYFLNRDNDKYNIEEGYKDSIKYYNQLLNESMEVYIDNKRYINKRYFQPRNIGFYDIKLKFDIKINNMSYMFYGCSNLTNIDFSSFDTKKVNNMSYMFYNCPNLIKVDLSSFDTKNVVNMNSMFYECSNLIKINLSSFDTKNVVNMSYMFCNCNNLSKINLSSFDTSSVNNMGSMFCNCSNLIEIDLSSFNTINVNNMSSMFCNCTNLINIKLSTFNTSNVNNMNSMFSGCSNLTFLDLSNFNIQNVKNINSIFSDCSKLAILNLSSFDIKNVIDMNDIIFNCSNLKEVKINNIKSNNRLKKELIGNNVNIIDQLGNNIN